MTAWPGTTALFASIPSPSNGTLSIGPLKIHAYGLMIALGVVLGVWLMGRRFEEKGIGTRDDANSVAVWAVIAGVIGSRLYSVATDWSAEYAHNLSRIPQIWKGGLGIPGGLIGGISVGAYMIKRKGIPVGMALNCAAPALALAQAVGRWGNYWNQELYGGPTKLPWGLEIDFAHRTGPAEKYATAEYAHTVFQPTFLYESLSNLVLVAVLLWIDRRFTVRPGRLIAMYVLGYGVIRFFVEGLRIDTAHHVGGLRWNQWVALAAVILAAAYLLIMRNLGTDAAAVMDQPTSPEAGPAVTTHDGSDDAATDEEAGDEGVDDDVDVEPPDVDIEPHPPQQPVERVEGVEGVEHALPSEG
jgi:prolipoprotein diacylglyceryl transferase